MSKLQEARQKRRAEGEARRATFRPKATGKPAELYQWWASTTGKARERENFCHYWRVVAIWAPLLKARLWSRRHDKPLGILLAVIIVAGYVTLCVEFGSVLIGTLIILGALDSLIGLYLGGNAAVELADSIRKTHDVYSELKVEHPLRLWALMLVALPGAIVGFVGLWLIFGIFAAIESKPVTRASRWFTRKEIVWDLTPLKLLFLGLLLVELIVPPFFGNWAFLIVSGALVVFMTIFTGLAAYADKIKKRQARERDELEACREREEREFALALLEPVFRLLFEGVHPRAAGDPAKFENWRSRYVAYVSRNRYNDIWQDVVRDGADLPMLYSYGLSHEQRERISNLLHELWARAESNSIRPVVTRSLKKRRTQPSWPRRLASGTGDFFSLLWQIIVVNKWKICPIVEFDEPAMVTLTK